MKIAFALTMVSVFAAPFVAEAGLILAGVADQLATIADTFANVGQR